MIIYFLRHASAGQKRGNAEQDRKRPIDEDGARQCTIMGRLLASLEVQVEVIVSSPLKRATQTASLVANEIGYDGKLVLDPSLEPDAEFAAFRRLLEKHSRLESIMVVGHNPSLSRFLSLLISDGGRDSAVELKKAAVAKVEISGRRPGALTWCVTPRLVQSIYESTGTSSRPKTSRK